MHLFFALNISHRESSDIESNPIKLITCSDDLDESDASVLAGCLWTMVPKSTEKAEDLIQYNCSLYLHRFVVKMQTVYHGSSWVMFLMLPAAESKNIDSKLERICTISKILSDPDNRFEDGLVACRNILSEIVNQIAESQNYQETINWLHLPACLSRCYSFSRKLASKLSRHYRNSQFAISVNERILFTEIEPRILCLLNPLTSLDQRKHKVWLKNSTYRILSFYSETKSDKLRVKVIILSDTELLDMTFISRNVELFCCQLERIMEPLQEIPSNDQINAVKMHDNNLKFGMPMSTRSWLSKRIEKREPEGGSITLSMYGKTFKICK